MEAHIEVLLHAVSLRPALVTMASQTIRIDPGLLIVLIPLGLADLALIVVALVSLVRRPTAGVRFHTKWTWVALIVLVNWIGPMAYLAVGRIDVPLPHDPAPATCRPPTARPSHDLLYGPPPEQR